MLAASVMETPRRDGSKSTRINTATVITKSSNSNSSRSSSSSSSSGRSSLVCVRLFLTQSPAVSSKPLVFRRVRAFAAAVCTVCGDKERQ